MGLSRANLGSAPNSTAAAFLKPGVLCLNPRFGRILPLNTRFCLRPAKFSEIWLSRYGPRIFISRHTHAHYWDYDGMAPICRSIWSFDSSLEFRLVLVSKALGQWAAISSNNAAVARSVAWRLGFPISKAYGPNDPCDTSMLIILTVGPQVCKRCLR